MNEKMEYLKKDKNYTKVIRTEILFTPFLVIFPFIVGILFLYNWYNLGFLLNDPSYDGELLIGIIIIIGNLIFDIPFIKSLRKLAKDKKAQ